MFNSSLIRKNKLATKDRWAVAAMRQCRPECNGISAIDELDVRHWMRVEALENEIIVRKLGYCYVPYRPNFKSHPADKMMVDEFQDVSSGIKFIYTNTPIRIFDV